MERRRVELETDYQALEAMQARSWEINFPGELFIDVAFRDALRFALSGKDEMYAYVKDGHLVGWLWLEWRLGRHRAHIRHIQVVEELWGQGYGRRIVCDAIALARAQQRTYLTLNVTKANERAMRLYAGLGFRVSRDMGPRQEMRLDLGPGQAEPEALG
jgi:ribosomal protein S18 acetylase RimI-like enzyme